MKCCGRCKRVNYCSVECQKGHWKLGGHKKMCGKEGGSGARGEEGGSGARGDGAGASVEGGARGDGAGASVEGDAPLQNPCPICLDNEDDGVGGLMCYNCGQNFCEKCSAGGLASLAACPTCRAMLDVSEQEEVRRLRRLLERPYGRYTPISQNNLGLCYITGTGVGRNLAEAARLFRLAADHGCAGAQHNLAVCYNHGNGVATNRVEALRLYRLAANQGNADAQYNLGSRYEDGDGVAQDTTEAVRLYRLAANQGFSYAQQGLSRLGL
jgi:hypothetical protein